MPTIEVSEETYEKIKDQLTEEEVVDVECYDDFIGHKWFIRTVTYHMVGRVVGRVGAFLKMEDSAWIADSGRFMGFIKDGVASEVEPVGTCYVNMDTAIDIFPWKHKLPKEQK